MIEAHIRALVTEANRRVLCLPGCGVDLAFMVRLCSAAFYRRAL